MSAAVDRRSKLFQLERQRLAPILDEGNLDQAGLTVTATTVIGLFDVVDSVDLDLLAKKINRDHTGRLGDTQRANLLLADSTGS